MTYQEPASEGADERASSDPLGSAAEEATKFVAALRDLVTGPAAEHLATGSAECQVCPLCRAVAALRDADPQSISRVTDSVVAVVAGAAALAEPVLRSLVDTAISTAQAASAASTAEPASDSDAGADPEEQS